jgi:hypothetical protein
MRIGLNLQAARQTHIQLHCSRPSKAATTIRSFHTAKKTATATKPLDRMKP